MKICGKCGTRNWDKPETKEWPCSSCGNVMDDGKKKASIIPKDGPTKPRYIDYQGDPRDYPTC